MRIALSSKSGFGFWVGSISLLTLLFFIPKNTLPQTPLPTLETSATLADKKKITIAIIQDGPSRLYDDLVKQAKAELIRLMADEKEIVFVQKGFNAQWNAGAVPGLLVRALGDPNIDMVYAVGFLTMQAAASPLIFLEKPVVSGLFQSSEILNMPISSEGRSTKDNFTFVVLNLPISRDFDDFHKMIGFQNLSLLVDQVLIGHLKGIQKAISDIEKKVGIKIRLIKGAGRAEDYLQNLGPDTQAVMLTGLPRMSTAEHERLIHGINQKRIPSFSLVGYPDVKRGVLAGLIPDATERTARRSALDMQQILLGFPATDLSVMMPIAARLLINGKTAKAIGYSPDFITLRTANITQLQLLEDAEGLTLDQAIRYAGERNIDTKISAADTQISKQQSLIERSSLLPQVDSRIEYNQIDRDRATGSLGILPQNRTTGNLNFSQVLFDDSLMARFRASRRDYKASQFQQSDVRLDSMFTGGSRYIDLLASLALLRIEAENLSLTQDNLEMARLRFEVGMSGLDEVYRWEAQEAQQRGLVFTRFATVQSAMVALNQALNVDQAKKWNPTDIPSEDVRKYLFGKSIAKHLGNLKKYQILKDFLVDKAFEYSPVLKGFVQQIDGQNIRLNQKKRKFYTPSFGAFFDYTREFQANRPGQLLPSQGDKNEWVFSGQARLPILQGGFRVHDMNQAKANLIRLSGEQTRALQLIEQQTRTVMNSIFSSGQNIYFSRRAADRAKLNLGIVKNKYAEGTVGILDLLDAQNEYITREQEAAIAIYTYLQDVLDLQRSVSWYAADHSPEEIDQFRREIEDYLDSGGKSAELIPETQGLQVEKDLRENSK